jgi:histidinol-phosphate aminotransferase
MSQSRREFVRTLGLGGAGVLSAEFIASRGFEEAMAMGLQQAARAPRAADAIVISSNENPRGPADTALDLLRGRVNLPGGPLIPDNVGALEDAMPGSSRQVRERPHRDRVGSILEAAVLAYASGSKALVNGTPSLLVARPDREPIKAAIKLVPVEKSSLALDLGAMADASKGAGLAFVCNPNNPTATVHSISAIADFVKKVRATSPGTAIHIDEAYLDYAADPQRQPRRRCAEYPDVFITRTFSKAYCMAGMRLGYAFGQPATLKKLSTAWGPAAGTSSPRRQGRRRSRTRPHGRRAGREQARPRLSR